MATERRKGASTRKVLDFIAAAPDAPKTAEDGDTRPARAARKAVANKDTAKRAATPDDTTPPASAMWPYNVVGRQTRSLTLTIPAALLDRLEAAAKRNGQALDDFALQLLERGLAKK